MLQEKKHAILAPSSAARWTMCTPSARLESVIPESDTPYTLEGTLAHSIAEHILKYLLFTQAKELPEATYFLTLVEKSRTLKTETLPEPLAGLIADTEEATKLSLDFSDILNCVYESYITLVYTMFLKRRREDPDAVLLIEAKLKLTDYIPEGFGSSDAVLLSKDTIDIFDLKYGKGVKVEAQENKQMRCYALGAIAGPGELYDLKVATMIIVQPRLNHISYDTVSVSVLQSWGRLYLKPLAEKAFAGEGTFVPGDHCRFCKVAATCRALHDKIEDEVIKNEPGIMSNSEIAGALKLIPMISSYVSSLSDYALKKALEGEKFDGYKLVEGRSVRKFTDEAKALDALEKAGYPESTVIRPKALKTITELEKLLKAKTFKEILGTFITRTVGKPTLVEESDPRKEYKPAEKDFENINL